MLTHKILNQYVDRWAPFFDKLEELQSQIMRKTIEVINILFDKVVKAFNQQAFCRLFFGLGGGVCAIAGGVITNPDRQKIFEAAGKVIPTLGGVPDSFIEGRKTRSQSEGQLKRDHELMEGRERKSKTSQMDKDMGDSISRISQAEHQAFQRSNG